MPRYIPYLLLLPATVFLIIFFLYPFTQVAIESFTSNGSWSLANFQKASSHWKFGEAFKNTMLLAALVVPIQLAMSLTMATVVQKLQKGRSAILYIFAIPLGISDLAAGLIWLSIFEQSGFLNSILVNMGLIEKPILYLSYQSPWVILFAIMLAEIWRATAIMMVILVAGLGLIPREYGEAAEVFGATRWQRFYKVTLPMLRPSLQTALILRVILAFEVFAVVIALGGTQMPVLMSETFNWQFNLQDRGVAAAYAMVILAVSVVFTLIILRALHVPKEARS
ncbi:carbohydrate ABC transporter permease [Paracoccus seriniphilus]|uniref:Carbohydrate ABC transporter membrane protein 1, CUT1 family n=1 Tax=Paracoccus seriniphilus TaxID=184748 RepID=A0A239Q0Q9_9RHOB|nr:sugar ABC transporter permease [Paracoccus seriniphilus]WCR15997.1 sugar ABC transporter permease [Paracoccus seriniphilus]SNT75497.1 carbohydrate ABC transporter membrane protein 1, CUT1 family [Paracoccus seriniphilus]